MHRRVAGRESLAAFGTQVHLGWTQLMQGRLADAEKTLREAMDGMMRVAPDAWDAPMPPACSARRWPGRSDTGGRTAPDSGYEGMATGKAVNPGAASRMSREQVGEALLQLYPTRQHGAPSRVGKQAGKIARRRIRADARGGHARTPAPLQPPLSSDLRSPYASDC